MNQVGLKMTALVQLALQHHFITLKHKHQAIEASFKTHVHNAQKNISKQ